MATRVSVDAEALLISWLSDAGLGDPVWVGGEIKGPFPLVRVTQIGGSDDGAPHWVDRPLLQVDVYGPARGSKAAIRELAGRTVAACFDLAGRVRPEGVAVGVSLSQGLTWLGFVEADRHPRYTFSVTLSTHPA